MSENKLEEAIDLLVESFALDGNGLVVKIQNKIKSLPEDDRAKLRYVAGSVHYYAKLLR